MIAQSGGNSLDILLVDDNEDDILLIQETIDEAKLLNVIQVVRDGEEAMAFLRREGDFAQAPRPGLVLLDINMPKKNGLEVLCDMKADPNLKMIPVVILTTSQREEDILQSYLDGASSYISKPVSFDNLRNVVRQFALYWAGVAALPPAEWHSGT